MRLSAFCSAGARKKGKGRKLSLLRAMLAIDARGLVFTDAPNGGKKLDVEVVGIAYAGDKEAVATNDRKFSLTFTAEEMKDVLASGLVYNLDIDVERPGPYQLRVAVWDENSGRLGSATAFVDMPDFSRGSMALSTVLLYDPDAKRSEELTPAGVIGAGSAITRTFLSGAVLKYDCTIFDAAMDAQTGKPKIDVEVRLFHGAERIFSGQPIALAIADGNIAGAVHAVGEVKLPATLPAGDYALELDAYDRLDKKRIQPVAQWVDFTLMR